MHAPKTSKTTKFRSRRQIFEHTVRNFGDNDYLEFSRLGNRVPSNRLCLADIKIGKHTWSPDANEEKRKQQDSLWLPQTELGYTWLGIRRVGSPKLDKHFGRSKTLAEIRDCFDAYRRIVMFKKMRKL